MSQNNILQLISIICRVAAMLFVATRFANMRYGFDQIIFRYVVSYVRNRIAAFKILLFEKGLVKTVSALPPVDFAPIEWLTNNMLYCYLLLFECSQFYLIMGLLHQFAINQVETKPWEFFFASPLTSISTILILREYFKKEARQSRNQSINQNQ